jgi:NDP-sugar pyrophosphorylase family protein
MTLPVAILAGGLATRLRPITEKLPKALVPVAGRPFVDHQLALLRQQGYRDVVLCVGYLGEMVRAHVGDGSRFSMRVDYQFDGPKLLGTGGALKRAHRLLGDAFFVLYGDSYLPCDFREVERVFRSAGQLALMTILKNDDRWDLSNVVYESGRVLRYSKRHRTPEMRYIDYGLSVLSAPVMDREPEGVAFDLADCYERLAVQGKLAGFEVKERFYEIGSVQGLAETELYLAQHSSVRNTTCPTPSST